MNHYTSFRGFVILIEDVLGAKEMTPHSFVTVPTINEILPAFFNFHHLDLAFHSAKTDRQQRNQTNNEPRDVQPTLPV
jgi:hypothetical protein